MYIYMYMYMYIPSAIDHNVRVSLAGRPLIFLLPTCGGWLAHGVTAILEWLRLPRKRTSEEWIHNITSGDKSRTIYMYTCICTYINIYVQVHHKCIVLYHLLVWLHYSWCRHFLSNGKEVTVIRRHLPGLRQVPHAISRRQ